MEQETIRKLLERYNEGQCTPEEAAIIDEWFDSIGDQYTSPKSEQEVQADLSAVQRALQKQIQPAPRRFMRSWYYAAAAITVLVAAGAWFFQQRQPSATPALPGQQPLAGNLAKPTRTVDDGFVTVNTPKGNQEHIILEDGSKIVLNAASRIRYPEHFSGNHRDIYLEEGEAWFDAAPGAENSFAVHAGDITATALGTTFNIRAYAHERQITIALLTGKVRVTTASQPSLILQPSEQASYDLRSLQLVKTAFDTEVVTGWQKGYLIFKDASYEQVRTGIENRYGVTIINQSDKKDWTYTGNFREETLANVIETICLTESLSYTIGKDTVILKNKK
ncbi:FecR family protein [Chitinophaga sp. CF418]|uniref:FecR family protein n=1 Tax=Chitinophaga sp. CF418 TaxID=1855287 RepID=UPI0009180F53|nr:FecR family protein [Chitinophaga sp. CF418]SHN77612.1 FecR family protein [Chitinophaga sp. CF418]